MIGQIRELMLEKGALHAMMSGSGPTVFGLFDSWAAIQRAANALRESQMARTVFATRFFNNKGKR